MENEVQNILPMLRGYHRHIVDMHGIVVDTTLQSKRVRRGAIGISIWAILPEVHAKRMSNAMFRVSTGAGPQWIRYRMGRRRYLAIVEYDPDDLRFLIHEVPCKPGQIKKYKSDMSIYYLLWQHPGRSG